MSLETIQAKREEILWWEVASLFHDIGKLSDDFLTYRQTWHTMPDGYSKKDPHDTGWYNKRPADEPPFDHILFEEEFKDLAAFFERKDIHAAVNGHMTLPETHEKLELLKLLKSGDGIDSQYDRNNPLPGNEQTKHNETDLTKLPPIFRSNVFGHEGPDKLIILRNGEQPGILDRARRQLYTKLDTLFKKYYPAGDTTRFTYEDYCSLRKLLREYFEPALSDTTRPCNDTSLWEHVYSVASITKALHARQLIEPGFIPNYTRTDMFRIWGFGFDSLRYLSYAHKIGDVLGRKEVLTKIFDASESLLQYCYPIGNVVYRDDNYIFFLVPVLPDALLEFELKSKIVAQTKNDSLGELVPHFAESGPVRNLTAIANCIERLREDLSIPVKERSDAIAVQASKGESICPVCRLRTVSVKSAESKICKDCMDRRKGSAKKAIDDHQSPYLAEIADEHGRLALIVAKFGLEKWLDGSMVRTTLITEPHGAERMLRVLPDFVDETFEEMARAREDWTSNHTFPYTYSSMFDEFNRARTETGEFEHSGFLYARTSANFEQANATWKQTREELKVDPKTDPTDEDLFNAICAKTATPSTVLDVWETTREFLENIATPYQTYTTAESSADIFRTVPPYLQEIEALHDHHRTVFSVVEDCAGLNEFESFDTASIDGKTKPVVFLGDSRFAILGKHDDKNEFKKFEGKILSLGERDRTFTIVQTTHSPQMYRPYRVITASPDLLLLLVPASTAVCVTTGLYQRYLTNFGKVYGRLPFSIGNIFFPEYLPMFSVLDAARRMERNFWQLHRKPLLIDKFQKPPKVNLKLGAGKESDENDYYHPYVLTKNPHQEAEGFFKLAGGGRMVSMHAENPPDDALLYPNYYDCEWLGSSADRLRIHIPKPKEHELNRVDLRKSMARPRGGPGPILLDDFQARVVNLWQNLDKAKVSDSHIRNLESLMRDREKAWSHEPGGLQALQSLTSAMIRHYLPGSDLCDEVERASNDGFLSYTLNLYLHVLKQKLGESDATRTAAAR